jgi:hypothetical protein
MLVFTELLASEPRSIQMTKKMIGALMLVFCHDAWSMDISVTGTTVYLSGPVVGGECDKLKQIISAGQVTLVVLSNSNGGNANTGFCIGETIRKNKISTRIEGFCLSSCSRMWLGGITRTLDGDESTVGFHGNYTNSGHLIDESTTRLREWIPRFAPEVDAELMNRWTTLFYSKHMMYFYNKRASLCMNGKNDCSSISGKNVFNAGLATR